MRTDSTENSSNRFLFYSLQNAAHAVSTSGKTPASKVKLIWLLLLIGWKKKKAVLANRKALHTIEPEEQASRSVNATVNDDRLVFLCG